MPFLDEEEKRNLLDEAFNIRERKQAKLLVQRERVREYYQRLAQASSLKEWENMRNNLCCMRDGKLKKMLSSTQEKVLRALSKGLVTSEAAFMSFFHEVCVVLPRHSEKPPRPSELLEMKKTFFGHRWETTCTHSIALLAYTLGLLEKDGENGLEAFEEERRQAMAIAENHLDSDPDRTFATTEFFERVLDERLLDEQILSGSPESRLASFKSLFNKPDKLSNDQDRRKELIQCFNEILAAHKLTVSALDYHMRENGCFHMKSMLQKRVLDDRSGELPQRDWIVAFCLYMRFREEETNRLLRCCGYVDLKFEPWEAGVCYLLRNPSDNDRREALERRENVFAILSDNGLEPPAALFASFPCLAHPNQKERRLFAALLLDCCAEVRQVGNSTRFRADFGTENPALPDSGFSIPDFFRFFSPPDSKSSLLRSLLRYTDNDQLPEADRLSAEYIAASERAKEWPRDWSPIRGVENNGQNAREDELISRCFPGQFDSSPAFRRQLLYSLLLYIVYTGHQPLRDGRLPAPFPQRGLRSFETSFEFEKNDETRICQGIAASVLDALFFW